MESAEFTWTPSLADAYNAALWCEYAYEAQPDDPTRKVEVIVEENAKLVIAEGDDTVACVIQGSDPGFEDKKDWIHNLQRRLVKDDFVLAGDMVRHGVEVHEGFRKHLNLIWEHIESIRKPVALYGHSLGAGCALIAFERLRFAGRNPLPCYLMAPPRSLSDSALEQHYDGRVWWFAAEGDLVPHVPSIGYEHRGNGHFLKSDGTMVEDWETWRHWRELARNKLAGGERLKHPHAIATYVEALEELHMSEEWLAR